MKNGKLIIGEKKKEYLWVSYAKKCLSFHPEVGYTKECFINTDDLWEYVYLLIEEGYKVL